MVSCGTLLQSPKSNWSITLPSKVYITQLSVTGTTFWVFNAIGLIVQRLNVIFLLKVCSELFTDNISQGVIIFKTMWKMGVVNVKAKIPPLPCGQILSGARSRIW